jgi:SAM-dependent methyltransferase
VLTAVVHAEFFHPLVQTVLGPLTKIINYGPYISQGSSALLALIVSQLTGNIWLLAVGIGLMLLASLAIRSNSLFERVPELKIQYQNTSSIEFIRFIDTEAILYYREIQEVSVPLPGSVEMTTVGGETDLRKFLSIGRNCFDVITSKIASLADCTMEKVTILDFGIGCARTARHFYRYQDQYNVFGCDVDSSAISYLKESVPFISSCISPNLPPLNFSPSRFDFIYSVSVFSHLNQVAYEIWLNELLRCTKPGGYIIFSIHGKHALDILLKNDNPEYISIDRNIFYSNLKDFYDTGYMWTPQWVGSNDIDSNHYGISFISDKKIQQLLPSDCILIEHVPGCFQNWQDLIIIQKK